MKDEEPLWLKKAKAVRNGLHLIAAINRFDRMVRRDYSLDFFMNQRFPFLGGEQVYVAEEIPSLI